MLAGKIGYFRATAHPEALAWQTRVVANGGSVSASTLAAVSNFCTSIDAAGLRSRFYRLNLFCGNNLAACLVPLYRGQSFSGTQFGNATDTNNSFVAADYNEASGLISNGSSKWLDTGLPLNFATGRHIGAVLASSSLGGQYLLGAWGASGNNSIFGIFTQASQNLTAFNFSDAGASGSAGNSAPTLRRSAIASSNPGAGGLALFLNGTSVGTGTAHSTTNTGSISIFGLRRSTSSVPDQITTARLSGYTIGTNLSAAEASAINDALATFNTAMGRVPPTVSNADAQSWINRVYANGGEVSTSTASAVNTFCNSIDSAGIRDRFFRLNLFAGTGLASALVPLYRGTSLAGTQFGNATDTNTNFTSTDYSETTGLLNATGTKFLSTGVTSSQLPASSGHVAWSFTNNSFTQSGFAWGVSHTGTARTFLFISSTSSQQVEIGSSAGNGFTSSQSAYGRWLGSRTSTSLQTTYRNGGLAAQDTNARGATTGSTDQFLVFRSAGGSGSRFGMNYYGFGESMTAAQAASFDSAVSAFLTALGRS